MSILWGKRRATPVVTDVADWGQVQALVDAAVRGSTGVDVAVHAAGVYGPIGPTADIDPSDWAKAITVNLVGTLHLCRAVLSHMKQRRNGKIILLGGGGATAPLPNFSAYAASKAGVVRLADTLAEELRTFNVQVNAIAPGLVDTRLQDEVLKAGERAGPLYEKIKRARESGAGAVSADLAAQLAVFLASSASGALTGKLISAPHDDWRNWTPDRLAELDNTPWYTLRRIDAHTLRP